MASAIYNKQYFSIEKNKINILKSATKIKHKNNYKQCLQKLISIIENIYILVQYKLVLFTFAIFFFDRKLTD